MGDGETCSGSGSGLDFGGGSESDASSGPRSGAEERPGRNAATGAARNAAERNRRPARIRSNIDRQFKYETKTKPERVKETSDDVREYALARRMVREETMNDERGMLNPGPTGDRPRRLSPSGRCATWMRR